MLVLLRISIGWHFLYQGLWKLEKEDFTSAPFLQQAKGPLADHFYALVPDIDGRKRLDAKGTVDRWNQYRQRLAAFSKFSDEQETASRKILEHRQDQLEEFLAGHREAIDTYLHKLDRLHAGEREAIRQVGFQEKRAWDERAALRAEAAPWLAAVDAIERDFQRDLDDLLDDNQRRAKTSPTPPTKLELVDQITMYSNLAIGVCLIVGLFTRFAALSGAAFLLMVVLAQPPWPTIYPPDPPQAGRSMLVNKEVVEMMAMLALAATPVGRWGGLDFFVHYLFIRPLFGKRVPDEPHS